MSLTERQLKCKSKIVLVYKYMDWYFNVVDANPYKGLTREICYMLNNCMYKLVYAVQ